MALIGGLLHKKGSACLQAVLLLVLVLKMRQSTFSFLLFVLTVSVLLCAVPASALLNWSKCRGIDKSTWTGEMYAALAKMSGCYDDSDAFRAVQWNIRMNGCVTTGDLHTLMKLCGHRLSEEKGSETHL